MENKSINIFDFDGTLTTETWPKFWAWVRKFGYDGTKRNDTLQNAIDLYRKTAKGNELITFFGFFNDLLQKNNEVLTLDELMSGEEYITYAPGLVEFLKSSSKKTNNYIVSGGIKEFLTHLEIAKYFKGIYGTELSYYSSNPELITGIGDPKNIMTDDKKIDAIKEIVLTNALKTYQDVYYIADGYSDEPAMTFVHNNGGKVIFVYHPNIKDPLSIKNNEIFQQLSHQGIIDYFLPADYSSGSKLSNLLQRRELSSSKAAGTRSISYAPDFFPDDR